jgi:hypothetical protein
MLAALLLSFAADPMWSIQLQDGHIVVSGLPQSLGERSAERLANTLNVTLVANKSNDQPPLLGTHTYRENRLTFTPRFPFAPGVAYRVVVSLDGQSRTHEFTIPKPKSDASEVVQVSPTAATLPENLLRLYVQFRKPMSKGDVYQHITLHNDTDRRLIDLPFLELDEELWSPDRTRFTLLIDPGRIKREVKPREDLGPALEVGKTFTLRIAKDWLDVDDQPLRAEYRKTFTVSKADREPVDPTKWTIAAPTAKSREALRVTLPKPHDAGLLQRLVWLERHDQRNGQRIEGGVTLSQFERVWNFVPQHAWASGEYELVIATHLEDVCGNRVGEPFEVDLFKPISKSIERTTVRRKLTIP